MADKERFVWNDDDFEIVEADKPDDEDVEKFNPFHDQQGRFSSEGGGTSITADIAEATGGGSGEMTGTAQWTRPAEADVRREYKVEYINHFRPSYGDIFPTEDGFVQAIKDAPTVEVDRKLDSRISGRSNTSSMRGLLSLISGYRSYPKYRNEKTLAALEDRIKTGKPTDMPIVTNDNGHMRVLSGNTRMDIGFMHNDRVKVIMLDVGKYRDRT